MSRPVTLAVIAAMLIGAAPADDRRSSTIVAVVQAEHDFATTALARGMKDAFLAFMAPEAVVFRPLPVPARPWFESRPAPKGQLAWRPSYAEGARAGDLGWTTGPWSFRGSPQDSIAATGQYVTVWKRQADGNWRFVIDAGSSHPPSAIEPQWVGFPSVPAVGKSGIKVERERERLMDQDRALAKEGTLAAKNAALLEQAADDVRVLRAGAIPAVGSASAKVALGDATGAIQTQPMGADVSTSGDIGYSYGLVLHPRAGAAADTSTYLRLWRRDAKGKWRIALDLDVPIRPS